MLPISPHNARAARRLGSPSGFNTTTPTGATINGSDGSGSNRGTISSASIRHRIEAIMTNPTGQRSNRAKRFLLASAGVGALIVPLVIGVGDAPAIRAESRAVTVPMD